MKIAVWWEQNCLGGVDNHLLSLLTNWPEKKDVFTIFTNRGNPGMDRIQFRQGHLPKTKIVFFPPTPAHTKGLLSKAVHHFTFLWRFWRLQRMAWQILRKHGPFDALLCDNGGYPGFLSNLAALWAGSTLAYPCRILLVHHAADSRAPFRHNLESLLDYFVQKWATGIITVSLATRETLRSVRGFSIEKCPMHVIHNGVQIESKQTYSRGQLRKRLRIRTDKFVIGMVGRIERYKGHEDLIRTLGELPKTIASKIVVLFVGSGDEQELQRLKFLATEYNVINNLVFTGYLMEQARNILKEFNLLAMLTKDFEGFGLSVAEAMEAGTPVLATTVGGLTEFVNHEVGTLVPPDSPQKIKEAILWILKNRKKVSKKAVLARSHIKKFSAQRMADSFYRYIRQGVKCP